jgi:hypothetical protein
MPTSAKNEVVLCQRFLARAGIHVQVYEAGRSSPKVALSDSTELQLCNVEVWLSELAFTCSICGSVSTSSGASVYQMPCIVIRFMCVSMGNPS